MIRILMIYAAVLTFAEFSFGRIGHADEAGNLRGEVVYAEMKPVKADGKNVAPRIIDLTKPMETSTEISKR